jgi:DNA repair exonuclease SbcCD ATPase subunit
VKIVNGKLLGRITDNSDIFKRQLESFNQQVEQFKVSFQELDERVGNAENLAQEGIKQKALLRQIELYVQHLKERYNNLEVLWEKEQERLSKIYQQEAKSLILLLQNQEARLKYLEITKLNRLEKNLTNLKQQIPTKLLWVTFSSSLIVGVISLCGWLNIKPLDNQLQKNQSWFNSRQLLVDYAANKKQI